MKYKKAKKDSPKVMSSNMSMIFGCKLFFLLWTSFSEEIWCVDKREEGLNCTKWLFLLSPQNLKFRIFNGMVGLFWSSGHVPLFDWVGLGSIPRGRNFFFLIPKDNF